MGPSDIFNPSDDTIVNPSPSDTNPMDTLLLPPASPPTSAFLYDLRYAYSNLTIDAGGFEEVQAVATLQGIVNRASPTLLVLLEEPTDSTWLAFAQSSGQWLAPPTSFTNITGGVEGGVEALVSQFRAFIAGVVLYDPAVFCTSSVADTAAAADDLLPIAFTPSDPRSLYARLVASGPRLPVALNLVGRFNGSVTGSVKRDAYTWAVDTYLRTNRSDGSTLGYFVDRFVTTSASDPQVYSKATLANRDFVTARRGFFFDLSVWADEAPVDEKTQPLGSDLAAFRYMLEAASAQVGGAAGLIRIVGFTPWAFKYVAPNGKHAGVETEWATLVIVSAFNGFVDADACCIGNMASASFWSHAPLAARYVQAPPPSKADLIRKGFLSPDGTKVPGNRLYYYFYAGDFDSAAWLSSQLLPRWQDPLRGTLPLSWGVDPGLSLRFPLIFPLLLSTAVPGMDVIITGDSGAGYTNPTNFYGPGRAAQNSSLGDGRPAWVDFNARLNRNFGLTYTGFAISGDAPQMDLEAEGMYLNCSGQGLTDQGWPGIVPHLAAGGRLAVSVQSDIPSTQAAAVQAIQGALNALDPLPQFHMFRSVLTSPSYLSGVAGAAANATLGLAVLVDAITQAYLMRAALPGGTNDDRVAYVNDTLPQSAAAGSVLSFDVTVRNDGWNALAAANHSVVVDIVAAEGVVDARGVRLAERKGNGMVELDALPHGAGSPLRARLARAGYAGRGRTTAAGTGGGRGLGGAASSGFFPFPSDLDVGGTVVVPVQVQLPQAGAGALDGVAGGTAAQLVTVRYQVVDGAGNTFASFGTPAWEADVLVV
jgi:hypothetical protein